jgi:ribose transport system permease protein
MTYLKPELERPDTAVPARTGSTVRSATGLLSRYPMVAVLGALLVVTSFVYRGFWSPTNLQNLGSQNAPLAVTAVGTTFVMIAGGFDLSVGATFAGGAVFYISMDGTLPVILAVLGSILVGLIIGAVNGIVVNVFGVNPFVATLGSASVITGLVSLYYFHVSVKYAKHSSVKYLGTRMWFGIPVSAAVAAVVIVIAGILLATTTYGRSIYAVGGNVQAARLNGLRVGIISASTFILIGALAAFGGVLQASQVGTSSPSFGSSLTLDSIAVVIIGGTSLLGGDGAVWRTVVGIAILAVINNVFADLSLDPNLQSVIKGLIVIVAVAVDVFVYRRQSR